ncbi:MAG: hypothetical protein J6M93_03610 [Succinivibrio sp.]|nr:hypothetical protein [Succinivibrio sp.]
MFYYDEMRLVSDIECILRKLYILRDPRDVPLELSPVAVLERTFNVQSLSILNIKQQHLLLRLMADVPYFLKLLHIENPKLRESAVNLLQPVQRAFFFVLTNISQNRGSHQLGGYLEQDQEHVFNLRKRRSRKILAFCLRRLDLAVHPDFPPQSLEPQTVEMALMAHYRTLCEEFPETQNVIETWIEHFDSLNVILSRELNHGEIPSEVMRILPPECHDFLSFLSNLVFHVTPNLTEYEKQRALAEQELLYILARLRILTTFDNPPYGLTAAEVVERLFSDDNSQLDDYSLGFIEDRREELTSINSVLNITQPDEFVKAYASLTPAGQVLLSSLQAIDKFYDEHGYLHPHDDYWFSEYFYRGRVIYESLSDSSDDGTEDRLLQLDKYCTRQKKSEKTEKEPLHASQEGDKLADESGRRFLGILEHLGILQDADSPHNDYDINALCRGLMSEEMMSHLCTDDVSFLNDRFSSLPLYLTLENLPPDHQAEFLANLKPEDRGFLQALQSLDDRFYHEALIKKKKSLKSADSYQVTDNVGQDRETHPEDTTVQVNVISKDAPLVGEKEQSGQDQRSARQQGEFSSGMVDEDPEKTAQRDYSRVSTARICHFLGLSYTHDDNLECTGIKSLRRFFDELFTLEQFVKLEKADQLFLIDRKKQINKVLEFANEKSREIKDSIYVQLEAKDQGFADYVTSLKYRAV